MDFDLNKVRKEIKKNSVHTEFVGTDLVVISRERFDELMSVFSSFRMVRDLLNQYSRQKEIKSVIFNYDDGKGSVVKNEIFDVVDGSE